VISLSAEKERLSQEYFADLYVALRKKLPSGNFETKSEEAEFALHFSFPLWMVKRWVESFGKERTKSLLETFNQRPPLMVRANAIKISREALLHRFQKRGYSVKSTLQSSYGITFANRLNLFDSEEFREGLFEVQDEGSQLICEMMKPKPGEVVWDVCAGGGGKSLALAAFMQNKGRIIATDTRPKKLLDLKKRARRAGVFNIFPADITRLSETSSMKKGVDKILIDAPCSGTGTLRRNPDLKWKLKTDDFGEHHAEQVKIVESSLPKREAKFIM